VEATARKEKLVTVTLIVKEGETETDEAKEILKGKTEAAVLKTELGVPPEDSLWVVRANGKIAQLADHEEHNVKQGDRFEVVGRGGVS
jgi:sulfur carrier protein ThiS